MIKLQICCMIVIFFIMSVYFFHEAGKNLSHGIRTSMNAIVGMTELMQP